MGLLYGRRERRINRALDNVLTRIDTVETDERQHCRTWIELDRLSTRMNERRVIAYSKAAVLHEMWQRIVAKSED